MLALSACAEAAPTTVTPGYDAGPPLQTGECAPTDAPRACACNGGNGTQSCVAGFWESSCDCSGFVGNTDGDPGNQPPPGMRCKAGYYEGTFEGDWRPAILDFGGPLSFPVEIEAQATDRGPGLAFTLEEKTDDCPTCEFTTYEVKGGCMVGTATIGIGDQHPFVATLTGELDCQTGKFTGNMDGVYSLFGIAEVLGIPGDDIANYYYFTGDFGNDAMFKPHGLIAQYDGNSQSIENGMWDLREKQSPPDSLPGAGGEGTWEATWKADQEPPTAANCRAIVADIFGDAGVPPPPAGDGGV